MRTIQVLGFISTLIGVVFGYLLLAQVDADTSASAAGGVGFGLIGIVMPLLAFSAFVLIPSSLALIHSNIRVANYFFGKLWLSLWGINSLISLFYLFVMAYVLYIYLTGAGDI